MNNSHLSEIVARFLVSLEAFKISDIPESINFAQMNEILISHHSTAIEGSSLTEDETRLLLTDGVTAKGKPLADHNMVKDHHNTLLNMLELAREKQPVSASMIQFLSAMVMKTAGGIINASEDAYDSSKREFRKSMIYTGTRYFTNFQKVPCKVEKLCSQINERLNTVKKVEDIYTLAFDAHFELVTIHPFADDNGRVSRLLMNYVQAYHSQPLAIIFNEDKSDYYAALEAAREQSNLQPFHSFMFGQQEKYFQQELKKLSNA